MMLAGVPAVVPSTRLNVLTVIAMIRMLSHE